MDTTTVNFNETHHVTLVLKGVVAEDLPTKPEEIDLRFLRMISMGDTYNGDNNPVNGVSYHAVIYGNQIAWQRRRLYDRSSCEVREEDGNRLYYDLYFASRLFLKVQEIAQQLFFGELVHLGSDISYMRKEDLELLRDHPQWKEMVRDFGLELHPTKERGHFKVVVTKFFQEA